MNHITKFKKELLAKSLSDLGLSVKEIQTQLKEKFGSELNTEKFKYLRSGSADSKEYLKQIEQIVSNTSTPQDLYNHLQFFITFFYKMKDDLDIDKITEQDLKQIEEIEKILGERNP